MTKKFSSESRDWLDSLTKLKLHFGRFASDIGGVLLLAFALISILALFGWTEGDWLTPWIEFISRWFGAGSYLVIISIGMLGILTLRRSEEPLPWGRLITLELAAFLTLGLLTIMGGRDLLRAEAGLDGGRLGWGLDQILSKLISPVGSLLIFLIGWFFAVMSGFNLWRHLEAWLLRVGGERNNQESFETEPEDEVKKKPRKAPQTKLPPEFRKSFSIEEQEDERPAKPLPRDERLPPLDFLLSERRNRLDERTINQTAGLVEKTLDEFGIPAKVIGFRVGPAITQFAVQPGFIDKSLAGVEEQRLMKVRVAQIASLQKDLALALSAQRLRIEAPVPGRSFVGIEVPNARVEVVRLRSILESESFQKTRSPLAIALGRDVSGHPVVADLAKMPHLLIAGSTGSGKSVCITSIATSLAMNNHPDDLRMVMVDSKMVELIRFNGLPHLFGKVETNIDRIQGVLRWVVVEMERRYKLLEKESSRDIHTYNRKVLRRKNGVLMPRIVVLIDEMADLMMSAPDQTEHNLVRLAQMARATGIHLVMATQRPSTDVVTGLIKANFPARIAFAVTSGVDSRVILDSVGAENLLGNGDMLFLSPEAGVPSRVQGVMITDQEIEKVINYWHENGQDAEESSPWETMLSEGNENEDESLIEQAVEVIQQSQRASASLLQRRLRIGYPRAARLLDSLEDLGIVGPALGGGRERDVLISPDDGGDEY
ncbi:MAG: DNA translocase FtsK [Anaerolineae bacterium]|jgi:DNA segregation ATPase FtsK/SpoIIIE, S-DNA-T family|nr:DNA translocase FtsK [Anaerolineae bacterium]MBT7073148.1 DNA translocase FtsK [Anaerolineae bacterium]MBT7326626.1 DNA translocase FtsK [Anaerolineae bacterium]